ncbi:hypothetical protein [Lutibacter sp.]|uniref:hypothetical protein n=1 Tax=Lutibacter sp. TaxID=1925666 RepID=UPI0025C440EE|nr:hypothetical protein [Lutibacter sp.]MCF6181536.1 hypothetical protein [Lutibacter sp.]
MFSDIIEAREEREISSDIWDNLNVGVLFRGSVNVDGSINIEGYIGNINMPGGGSDYDLDIGSGYGRRGNSSYAGSGYGQNKGSGVGDVDRDNPLGNNGNDGFRGVPGQGHSSAGGNSWDVESSHFSQKHSDSNGTTSFYHNTSSVSSDSGYHSETDTQHVGNSDGSSVTRTHVSQTQPDGSNATCDKTTTKDADGNTKTTITVTKTDADGNVTSEKTIEKDSYENPMDEENGGNAPPGPIEIQMAVYRAVTLNSLAGGNIGDANDPRSELNQNSDGNVNINDGSKLGNFKAKTTGGKLKTTNRKTNLINPGLINKKEVNKTIKN